MTAASVRLPRTLSMDLVVDAIESCGIPAYVEQTGGGCATIFAGWRSCRLTDHDEQWTELCDSCRWTVGAGPGWFEGPGWTLGRAYWSDFYIGRDDDALTDDFTTPDELRAHDETQIGARIVAMVMEWSS